MTFEPNDMELRIYDRVSRYFNLLEADEQLDMFLASHPDLSKEQKDALNTKDACETTADWYRQDHDSDVADNVNWERIIWEYLDDVKANLAAEEDKA